MNDEHAPERRLVGLRIGREWWAIPAEIGEEIVSRPQIQPIPGERGAVLGVIYWRGALVPVVDVGPTLGTYREEADPRVAVMMRLGGRRCGIAADEVAEVLRASADELRTLPASSAGGAAVRSEGRLYTVLDPEQLQPIADRGVPVAESRQMDAQLQIVTFRVGVQEFGLDVFQVHEILRRQEITPVPEAPDFVEGVIDLRGTLVPVIDLRRRFEVADPSADDEIRIVVVPFGEDRLGLVVDGVSEVLRLPESTVSEPPSYFRGLAAEYMRGIARADDRLVVLLDMDAILSSEERIALEEMDVAGGDQGADPTPGEQESGPDG